jgi:L-alanine-DL-glutamate epimerase-like enolase superfamily enzyme
MPPRLTITSIELAERRAPFRTPFRFGAVTVHEATQLFVHATIELEDGGRSRGASAELMVPKWFNKNPAVSADETVDQLRRSVEIARALYLDAGRETAFGLHAAVIERQIATCAAERIPPLAAAFGPAEIDKAVLDALLRATRTDFFSGMRENVAGLDNRLTADLAEADIVAYLGSRAPSPRISVRHTVGMLDSTASVREAATDGIRYFKIKLCGEPDDDRARLTEIAGALAGTDYRATADANEQYRSMDDLHRLCEAIRSNAGLHDLAGRLLYIEQPFAREETWQHPLQDLGAAIPFIIDEADDTYDAFLRARALGYRGVSTKSCKGIYKSLLNGARAACWNKGGSRFFVSAEDLTCQAGLAIQQDTALVALHGLTHAERNGHHYVDGFADTPHEEAKAFLAAHPDLYERAGDTVRLAVGDGALSTASLITPGFACALDPDRVGAGAQALKTKEYQT